MTTFELRILPLSELKPAPYNPRRVLSASSAAYRKLKASLTEFGLVEPLVWNETTGFVVGGHARLRILKELGVEEVPVSVVRLTEAREKALNVVLNNQEAQSRYDPGKLTDLLTELADLPELELTGFDGRTLSALQLKPTDLTPVPEREHPDRVEITLVTNEETYAKLVPSLDKLIAEYDLVSHVRVL
ncbi:MAG: ParB N-terminal domain-containing protein [Planctomycetia bacterium]|nr:ParB N-terminal domain-containing protein [Planctomycetia bacterium]